MSPANVSVWEMVRDGRVVADVIGFSDGQTITKWRGARRSLTVWESWADAAVIHTHGGDGTTQFRLRAHVKDLPAENVLPLSSAPVAVK